MTTVLLNLFFQGLPEMTALLFTAFTLAGYNAPILLILRYGLILSSLIWFVRLLPVPFGVHTIIGLFIFVLILYRLTTASMTTSFGIAFSVMFLVICTETAVHIFIDQLFGVNSIVLEDWLWIISGWPQVLIIAGMGLIIKKWIRPSFKQK